MKWIISCSVVYLLIMSLVLKTTDSVSAIIFKVIPFFIGVANLIVVLKMFGVI